MTPAPPFSLTTTTQLSTSPKRSFHPRKNAMKASILDTIPMTPTPGAILGTTSESKANVRRRYYGLGGKQSSIPSPEKACTAPAPGAMPTKFAQPKVILPKQGPPRKGKQAATSSWSDTSTTPPPAAGPGSPSQPQATLLDKKQPRRGKNQVVSTQSVVPTTPPRNATLGACMSTFHQALLDVPQEIWEVIWTYALDGELKYGVSVSHWIGSIPVINFPPLKQMKRIMSWRYVSLRSLHAFHVVATSQLKWRIKHTESLRDWKVELSKLQRFTPTMQLQPKRISLVIARIDTVHGHVSGLDRSSMPLDRDYRPTNLVSDTLAAIPDLTELELVFEIRGYMDRNHWSFRACLWDHAIKGFWALSNEHKLMLSRKIEDGLSGKTMIVNEKVRKVPQISIITRVAGFENNNSCSAVKSRTGTEYLESERKHREIDWNAEYHTRRYRVNKKTNTWLPAGKRPVQRGPDYVEPTYRKMDTYFELESDITDFWQNLEGLARVYYDQGLVMNDPQAEVPFKKYGFGSSEDFGRACFQLAVARHQHVLKGASVYDEMWLQRLEREWQRDLLYSRSAEDHGW